MCVCVRVRVCVCETLRPEQQHCRTKKATGSSQPRAQTLRLQKTVPEPLNLIALTGLGAFQACLTKEYTRTLNP